MVLGLLIGMMLAAKSDCKATTDIQEFETQIQRACGERIQSVSFTGNHDSATYVITYAVSLTGREIAGTDLSRLAWQSAVTSHTVLHGIYPMKRFEYSIKDTNGQDVCDFVFEGDEEKPTTGACVDGVR